MNDQPWRIVLGFVAAVCVFLAGTLLILTFDIAEEYGWYNGVLFYLSVFASALFIPVLAATGYLMANGIAYALLREPSIRGALACGFAAAAIFSIAVRLFFLDWTMAETTRALLMGMLYIVPVMIAANTVFALIAGLPWRAARLPWRG